MASHAGVVVLSLIESLLAIRFMSYDLLPRYRDESISNAVRVTCIALIVNCSSLLVWKTVINPSRKSPFSHLPQPKWFLLRAAFAKFVRTEFIAKISQETPNTGIIALWEVFRYRLLLTNVDVTTELLVKRPYDFTKVENVRKFMTLLLGSGLIVLEGDKHKIFRKSSLQAFSYRQVQNLYPSMWEKALRLVDKLHQDIRQQHEQQHEQENGYNAGIVDMASWAYKVTVDIIGIMVLGLDFNSLSTPDSPLIQNYKAAIGPGLRLYRIMAVWLSYEFVQKLPWGKNKEFRDSVGAMKNICRQIVHDKKEEVHSRGVGNDAEASSDILSHLIETSAFSDTELADQVLTYLIAGHDTTQSALLWTCYLLCKHPEWQSILRDEVKQGISRLGEDAANGRALSDCFEKLPYLNGVLNEALRLYPIIPLTSRVAVRDTTLGGQAVPKGTEVLISPWVINRAPSSWGKTADEFDPRRWIDDDGLPNKHGRAANHHDIATFLHGPRSCIGVQLAKAELRCLIGAMACHYEWTLGMPESDMVPGGVVSIAPLNGLRLKLRRVSNGEGD
ncbi:cytochrome P450 [Nemania sp. FL0916]|nr:cytochrome P450 [Nemania sp. FL0916]